MTLDIAASLPTKPEDIDPQWLTSALGVQNPGTSVASIEGVNVIWGNATKVLVDVIYDSLPDGVELPTSLCCKGGLDERLTGKGDPLLYTREAVFYGDLSRRMDLPLPACYYAGVTEDGQQGVIVLENIAKKGARFIDGGDSLTPDEVTSGLEAFAALHGSAWGSKAGDLPNVEVGGAVRRYVDMFFKPDYWDNHFVLEGAPVCPLELQYPARIRAAFDKMWATDDAGAYSLLHGDAHVGNTYVNPSGQLVLIDWQAYCLGPWPQDISNFLAGALPVEARRANERDLIKHYLTALQKHGAPRLAFDDAFAEYAKHLLYGFTWTMCPPVMQPMERVAVMGERYLTAMVDNETLGLVENG